MIRSRAVPFALAVCLAAPLGAFAESTTRIGKQAPSFRLSDARGVEHALPAPKDAKLVVVAFLGTECPLVVNLYAVKLQRLADDFRDQGVRVVAVMSNAQDSAEDVRAFVDDQGLTFPVLLDPDAKIADAYGASRTPEVFLLDSSRTVRYQGRIDDQGRVGVIRTQPDRDDLREAVKELLAGKEVSKPALPAVGCLIGRRAKPKQESQVTYASHVAAILQKRCLECHRAGEIGPFSMESYEEVAGWAPMIREVVDQERMPPWFASPEHGAFSNDARLSDEEKRAIAAWVEAGAPLGDPAKIPEGKKYVEGWNIGEPDVILPMSDKPFSVPAEGVVDYKHYVVDPEFTEDKWMVACEVRPGNRSVVHHVLVFCRPPGQRRKFDIFDGGLIAAYAPGTPAFQAPKGVARKLPAGSKIVIQMHYTPNGRAQEDLSRVGFRFCDAKEVKQEIEALAANNFFIAIPPGAPDHIVRSRYVFKDDRLLVNLAPHMHMRGKSFRYEAAYPDGRREILLDVPRFDFNWQFQYNLAEPKLMPKGTVIHCTAHYDNSAANPANPDPKQFVTFGEQTWDEMMIGWFTAMTLPRDDRRAQSVPPGSALTVR